LYVVDGLDFSYFKSSFRYELVNQRVNWGKVMPIKAFKLMPLRIYLALNNDVGYVNDPQFYNDNSLTNNWLWGGGLGLDIIIFYGSAFQIEYSMNQLKEKGLFLHYKLTI
jgi:hypothetical protein